MERSLISSEWKRVFYDQWPNWLQLWSTALLALLGIIVSLDPTFVQYFYRWTVGITVGGTFGLIVGSHAKGKREKRVSELEADLEANRSLLTGRETRIRELEAEAAQVPFLKYEGYCHQLGQITAILGLGMNDRVSLYKYQDGRFFLVARDSRNPLYARRSTRAHPPEKGCIGLAWQKGESFEKDVPSPTTEEAYYRIMKSKFGYDRDELIGLRMRARCFYGKCVNDQSDQHGVAVLVIESTAPRGLKRGDINAKIGQCKVELANLVAFIERHGGPSLAAEQSGF